MGPSQSILKEWKDLKDTINKHNHDYYVMFSPTISDNAYDSLMRELIRFEEYHQLYSPTSPTQKVGAPPVSNLEKLTRKTPMLSIQNAFTEDDLYLYDERMESTLGREPREYIIEPKLDGASMEVVYFNGKLVEASTRGDGITGEDVTHNAKVIKNLPLEIPLNRYTAGVFTVRGEVIITEADFKIINEMAAQTGDKEYSNARNLAAGSIRLLDSRKTVARRLQFIAHTPGKSKHGIPTYSEYFDLLSTLGIVPNAGHVVTDIAQAVEAVQEVQANRPIYSMGIDGAVIKLNNFKQQARAGATSKFPKGVIAYKFPPEEITTTVESVDWQVGRLGTLTPVARVSPVFVGGVKVTSVTLNNLELIQSKQVTLYGKVLVRRAGDVIPEVVRGYTTDKSDTIVAPEECPECGAGTVMTENSIVYCPNSSCIGRITESIKHFGSRKALNIKGLGSATIQKLFNSSLVRNLAQLYMLDIEGLKSIGLGPGVSANLLNSLEVAKNNCTATNFIYGLGIPLVGKNTAGTIASLGMAVPSDMLALTRDSLKGLPDIGEFTIDSIMMYITDADNMELLHNFDALGFSFPERNSMKNASHGALANMHIVLTGKPYIWSNKAELQKFLQGHGAKVSSTVTKATDMLIVCGESVKITNKIRKARQNNIDVLYEPYIKEYVNSPSIYKEKRRQQ